jgi:hypothetical protein
MPASVSDLDVSAWMIFKVSVVLVFLIERFREDSVRGREMNKAYILWRGNDLINLTMRLFVPYDCMTKVPVMLGLHGKLYRIDPPLLFFLPLLAILVGSV